MLRLVNLSNKYVRRTLRVLYGQTQATPYDVQLSSSFTRTGGAIAGTATTGITGSLSAILPGLVATKVSGEVVTPATTWAENRRDFGLFANFVGGEITDIPSDFDRVGVWRGPGSVYELLAPSFDTTDLSTDDAAEDGTADKEVYLNANAKAQLKDGGEGLFGTTVGLGVNSTARLIDYLSANAIVVELLV